MRDMKISSVFTILSAASKKRLTSRHNLCIRRRKELFPSYTYYFYPLSRYNDGSLISRMTERVHS